MAFGQPAGPPASQRQIDQLVELLDRAGFSSFREARHPYGLSQRQAGGRFTVAEADELLERLEAAEAVQQGVAPPPEQPEARSAPSRPAPAAPQATRAPARVEVLSAFADDLLVAELERRGWCCIPPISTLDEQG